MICVNDQSSFKKIKYIDLLAQTTQNDDQSEGCRTKNLMQSKDSKEDRFFLEDQPLVNEVERCEVHLRQWINERTLLVEKVDGCIW